MSISRCYIRRYQDAPAPRWRAEELECLIEHYRDLRQAKARQIAAAAALLRELEAEAGKASMFGCRGLDCGDQCSGLCYITYCTDERVVSSWKALLNASHALSNQQCVIGKKLAASLRVRAALIANYPYLAMRGAA